MKPPTPRAVGVALSLVLTVACGTERGTVVTGTLVGHDGDPLAVAHVHLLRPGMEEPVLSLPVGRDGRFEMTTADTGALMVRFTGIQHVAQDMPLYVDSALVVEVDVRLAAVEYADSFDDVTVIGPFNAYSVTTGVPLEPLPDGRMTATIPTEDSVVRYVLVGLTADPYVPWVHGTDSRDFDYHTPYGYQSVVPAHDGAATVVFDPARLVRGSTAAEVRFRKPTSRAAWFHASHEAAVERIRAHDQARKAHLSSADAQAEFAYDWSADVSALEERLADERDPLLRRAMLLDLVGLADLGADIEPTIFLQTLQEVPPLSGLWSYAPAWMVTAVRGAQDADSTVPCEDYLQLAIDSYPNPSVQAGILTVALLHADDEGDQEKVQLYYERLIADHPDTRAAQWARALFSTERAILSGKPMPAFALRSLDDPATTYANTDVAGVVYLIDVWATWCTPCMAEMPNLHEAYERYGDRGFEILSVAVEDTRDAIAEFRTGRWPMPWLHTLHGMHDEALAPFEIQMIPRGILVDQNGTIVGADAEIRGERLHDALARLMDEAGG
jgi:thiol-disulfide isomerase/thioredoxin